MRYPGGKNGAGIYQRIISLMPPHQVYVEPFLGSGAVLRLKRPAELSIGLDLSGSAIGAFNDTDVRTDVRIATAASEALSILAALGETRVSPKTLLLNTSGLDFLELASPLSALGSAALIYCDPPYLPETISSRCRYLFDCDDVDHRRLLRWSLASPNLVMISGYWSEMYAEALSGWSLVRYQAMTRRGPREECLWFNFPPPTELHDYRYLGAGFRERERIKRKKARWTARLSRMPILERQALLAAIADTAGRGDAS